MFIHFQQRHHIYWHLHVFNSSLDALKLVFYDFSMFCYQIHHMDYGSVSLISGSIPNYQYNQCIHNWINMPLALLSVSPNIKWCITRMWYHPVISIVIAHKLRIWGLALNLILNLIHKPHQCLIQLIWVANIINILCHFNKVNL